MRPLLYIQRGALSVDWYHFSPSPGQRTRKPTRILATRLAASVAIHRAPEIQRASDKIKSAVFCLLIRGVAAARGPRAVSIGGARSPESAPAAYGFFDEPPSTMILPLIGSGTPSKRKLYIAKVSSPLRTRVQSRFN